MRRGAVRRGWPGPAFARCASYGRASIGEPPGLAFGKPEGELRDAVLRTAMPGHDGSEFCAELPQRFGNIERYLVWA